MRRVVWLLAANVVLVAYLAVVATAVILTEVCT